jgi:hypothetical protein
MNLKQPSIQVLQAFVNLRVNTDFETIQEWLRECRKTTRDELEKHTDDGLFARVQGRSQTLRDLIDLSQNAAKLLEETHTRIEKNEQRRRISSTPQGRSGPN